MARIKLRLVPEEKPLAGRRAFRAPPFFARAGAASCSDFCGDGPAGLFFGKFLSCFYKQATLWYNKIACKNTHWYLSIWLFGSFAAPSRMTQLLFVKFL
ncbi:MAG: hypothetical protein HPY58_04310 [Firmicutes bacterium]|nr:hypothetical protein [Bacillota bacterium]